MYTLLLKNVGFVFGALRHDISDVPNKLTLFFGTCVLIVLHVQVHIHINWSPFEAFFCLYFFLLSISVDRLIMVSRFTNVHVLTSTCKGCTCLCRPCRISSSSASLPIILPPSSTSLLPPSLPLSPSLSPSLPPSLS